MRFCGLMGCFVVVVICVSPSAWAIIQNPSQSEISEAIQRGKNHAQSNTPPNLLYWRFGSSDNTFEPHGYVMTKINGIAVMSAHFALRGEEPAVQDIQRILEEKAMQVVVVMFGDSPGFAADSYLLLRQGEKLIKPDRIRFDARASSVGQIDGETVYRAKVVASFLFDAFDREALTTVKVFPGIGGEMRFDLDFSAIP